MAVRVELSCLETFPLHVNPLHVLLCKSKFEHVFPTNTDSTLTLLFAAKSPKQSGKLSILLSAHATTQEEARGCRGENVNRILQLYASKLFLRHYGLKSPTTGTVRLISPFALSKVVVGARTRQSFKWALSERFSSGLLVLSSCQEQVVLAREGDPLLLPYHPLLGEDASYVQQQLLDLVVLECVPVKQGMITNSTSLVVSDFCDIARQSAWVPPGGSAASRHLTWVFASDFAHYVHGLSGRHALLDNKKVPRASFSDVVHLLECRVDVQVVDVWRMLRHNAGDVRNEVRFDVDSCVFLSKTLLLKLGLFNREWVILSRFNSSSEKKSSSNSLVHPTDGQVDGQTRVVVKTPGRMHLSLVVVADFIYSLDIIDLHDNVAFISPTHWFNLTHGEQLPVTSKTMSIKRWNSISTEPGNQVSESLFRSAVPPFAKELHIELVTSPEYNQHGPFDTILHEHFVIPRLVCQGDILAIPAEDYPELLENNTEGIHRFPVIYFKVKKVCGPAEAEDNDKKQYLTDRLHTSLYMAGFTSSFVPSPFVGENPSLLTSLSPQGLSSTVDHITTIILPHMKNNCAALSRCTILLQGPGGSGKVTVVRAVCRRLHLHLVKVDCVTMCADTAAACEAKMRSAFQRAEAHGPCILLLRNVQLLGQPKDGTEEDARVQAALCELINNTCTSVVVIATLKRLRDLSADVMAVFVHQVSLECPSEDHRKAMLASLSKGLPLGKNVSLAQLAKHTAGFFRGDLSALLTQAGKAAHRRLLKSFFSDGLSAQQEEDLCVSGVKIVAQDFSTALETLQDAHSQAIGAPKIPSVRWQDIGGLEQVKREILNTVQLPLERPELLSVGLQRVGLLLHGPPGTGKTLLAKAVATECSMTFLSVKGPELINMYVGQSEENVREVFSKARAAAPCIIFFDELDSLVPNRGHSGDSGGVMDRVVSQVLAELDGLHQSRGVFVIGATNRPDLLDQSLLRPGRFDKLIFVGINEDKESQLQVLKAIVRKFKLDPSVSLEDIVERCPSLLTGADMYALCSDAMMAAIKRKISQVTYGLDTESSPVILSAEDFNLALDNLKPSVSEQELLKYKHIQQKLIAK